MSSNQPGILRHRALARDALALAGFSRPFSGR